MSYRDRVAVDDIVDVWDDEIPNIVLDRLGHPKCERIALRACFPMGVPNRLYCFDNDRNFSDTYMFHRTATPTGHVYALQGDAGRADVTKVMRAFSNPSYTVTKDRHNGPRKYTAWHRRTVRGPDFQANHAGRII